MMITIREYQSSDKDTLLVLIKKLHDFVVGIDPAQRVRHMPGYGENYLKKTLANIAKQNGKIYFAESGGEIIGFTVGVVGEKQSEEDLLEVIPNTLGIVLDLYVDENYRGQHVGTLLIEKIAEYLKSVGCDNLWVQVFAPNEKAHTFYKKFGFMDREIGMVKKI